MELEKVLLKRRSIRKFNDNEISDEIINKLMYFAMCAPSACNKRPWEFYVVKNKDLLGEVKKASRFSNHNAPLAIVVAGNLRNSLPLKMSDYWIQDCSSAITHILLEATSLGLGSLWCGLYPQKRPMERIRNVLNLDDKIMPLGLLLIGYSDEEKEERSQYEEQKVHIYE